MLDRFFRKANGSLPDEIDALEDRGHVQIIRFKGVLDKTTLPDDSAWGNQYIEEHHLLDKNILVDFRKVERVDSAALAVCLMRLQQFKKHGHKIALINVPENFRRLAEIEKISDEIVVYPSEEAALKDLQQQ